MKRFRVGWFVAFLLVIGEVALMAHVSSRIGFLPMLLLLFVVAVLGVWLVKVQGMSTLTKLRSSGGNVASASAAVTDGVLILVGGLLFIVPGFISDALGCIFLFPPTRKLARNLLLAMIPLQKARPEWVVVEGETVPDQQSEDRRPGTVIRGYIEP